MIAWYESNNRLHKSEKFRYYIVICIITMSEKRCRSRVQAEAVRLGIPIKKAGIKKAEIFKTDAELREDIDAFKTKRLIAQQMQAKRILGYKLLSQPGMLFFVTYKLCLSGHDGYLCDEKKSDKTSIEEDFVFLPGDNVLALSEGNKNDELGNLLEKYHQKRLDDEFYGYHCARVFNMRCQPVLIARQEADGTTILRTTQDMPPVLDRMYLVVPGRLNIDEANMRIIRYQAGCTEY